MRKAVLVVVLLIMLAVMPTALADDVLTFTVASNDAVVQDGVVTVPIIVTNNPGFNNVILVVSYDAAVLEIIDVIGQREMPINKEFKLTEAPGRQIISLVNTDFVDWSGDGVVVNLVFKAKTDATIGESDITLAFRQEPYGIPVNAQYERLTSAVTMSGSVRVDAQEDDIEYPDGFEGADYLLLDGWTVENVYGVVKGEFVTWTESAIFVKKEAGAFESAAKVSKDGVISYIGIIKENANPAP